MSGTDVSAVILKELILSEEASAFVESGAVLNLTEPFEISVTGSDGTIQVWTVTSKEEEKPVTKA